jgi:hypothetical protein
MFGLVLMSSHAFSQQSEWVKKDREHWPQVSMVNEVWYRNGERYVHPSFEYAATGFLIDTGTDTLAATVKHALWVAKTKSMKTVDLRDLKRWVMHPKGNLKDSVVIDHLINTDTTEALSGPQSSITQRDWLVFTTGYRSPAIQPLRPRYTRVQVGERIYFTGCPYTEANCPIKEAQVIEVEGNRIILTMPDNLNLGGYSGSPLIDKDGYLIGILGGSSFNRRNGSPALYGISTQYLKAVLTHKQPLNVALIPINAVIKPIVLKQGFKAGMRELKQLLESDTASFTYDFSMENINRLGDEYKDELKLEWAVAIYKLNADRYCTPATYLKLADGYVLTGDKKRAVRVYNNVLKRWPGNKEATEGLSKLQ